MAAAPPFSDVTVFHWRAQTFRADLIFLLPIALCLAIGIYLQHPGAALIAAGGSFTVGFATKQRIDQSHILPMILASLGISLATFIGMVAGHTNVVLVLIAATGGFLYGMLSLRQPGVGWVGQQSIVFFLVASAFPSSPRAALTRALLVLAGAALQILTSSILLRLLTQLRTDLLLVASYIQQENQALRLSVQQVFEGKNPPSALPYALRLAITLGVSTEIYRHYNFANGYWIPMTALLVLRPGLSDTANRAIARTLGTLIGAILATFALAHLAPAPPILALLVLFFAWLSYALNTVNYGLFTLCLTAYIVCLLALNKLPGSQVAYHRLISTILGGTLALSVRLIVIRYRDTHPGRSLT